MYGSKLLKWDVPHVKEFIQNLLPTPEAKQYDQYNKMLINIQSKNNTYDMMYVWPIRPHKRKFFATQTMEIYEGPYGGTLRTLPIDTSRLLLIFPT